ncbi:MAG: twin transmembrane helix small protein [Candidatus Competibacteraceae bacterium]|nr:twin transmembrane helix small protein [Candidatus Competibacteraceae bacterium]MCB1820920.1 twin transmembrane helix small protein [Candidatus Competibacteraceae bacterium]MCP5127089.1 twin transmembrane helix small protein [Gammaproteobacteria bacterium]HRX69794.1 twin transmembrane helix small protein [Candidatus Competibacteraceae bacterium]
MLIKIIVAVMLLLILASLGSGLFFLIRDGGHNPRTVKALTVRIALSVALFILLMVAYATGLITPHGVMQRESAPAAHIQ